MSHSALKTLLASAVSGAILVVATQSSAQAGAFALREQSTVGQGMSFAGAAAGAAGLGSMFWNPATITDMPGMRSEQSLSLIVPSVKLSVRPGSSASYFNPFFGKQSSGDEGQDALLPAGYSSYQLNDRIWVGLSTGAPYGLATKPDANFAGRVYGNSTKVSSLEVTPTVGVKLNDWLSVGAGLRVLYFHTRYTSAIPGLTPATSFNVASLEGDDTNVGFSLGATIKPWEGGEIGIGYRSMVRQTLSGDFTAPGVVIPIKVAVNLPEQVTFGVRQQVTQALTLSAGVEWTNFSRIGYPRTINQNTGGLLASSPFLPLDYKDGWYFSVGGEYRIDPAWTVRAGLGYEVTPIRDESRSIRLPDTDRIWTSLGASYNWNEKLRFDLGYTHIFNRSATVRTVGWEPELQSGLGCHRAQQSGC